MAISEKINNYLLKKVSRSKIQYLFAVSKEYLLTQVHELNQQVKYLGLMNDNLSTKVEVLQKKNNTLKTQIEADTDIKYRLAYERLTEKYNDLKNENKSVKASIETVNSVVESVSKQNEQLKEQNKILFTQNERLTVENKKYKEKEKVVEIKQENKAVNHNFTKKVNTNSRVLSR